MGSRMLAVWIAREWTRSAVAWILAGACLLLGPVLWLATPWSILDDAGATAGYLDSIWYVSALCGVLVGLVLLDRAGVLWNEAAAGARTRIAMGLLFVAAVLYGLVSFAVAATAGRLHATEFGWGGAAMAAAHWAALGTFAQRWRPRLGERCFAVAMLGWFVPSMLAPLEWERARWMLSPLRHLEARSASVETSAAALVDTIPLIAWWVAAALLPTRGAFKR